MLYSITIKKRTKYHILTFFQNNKEFSMKNEIKTIGILMLLIALIFTIINCQDNSGGGGGGITVGERTLANTSYTWSNSGTDYELIISEKRAVISGNFLLLITAGGSTTSITGTAAGSGNDIILTSKKDSVTLTINGSALTVSKGTFAGEAIASGKVTKKDGNTGSSNNPFIGIWSESVDSSSYSYATLEIKNSTFKITYQENIFPVPPLNGTYVINGGKAYFMENSISESTIDFTAVVSGNKLTITLYNWYNPFEEFTMDPFWFSKKVV
jgi:hypothetical protein